jgi:hypothetical protein
MELGVTDHAALHAAKSQLFASRSGDANFAGCGVGLRRRGGKVTGEPVVVAMVVKKLPAGALSRSRLLPKTVRVEGREWGVDVVEVGTITLGSPAGPASPDAGGPITQKLRPPLQGCGISDASGSAQIAGALGCLVRDKSDGKICILGSNFVLAQSGTAPIGTAVIQPSQFDGGGLSDKVATLKRFVAFSETSANETDAAIAQLTHQRGHSDKVADHLMAPISATHPAVGICVAADNHGLNCFLSPIDVTLSQLGVELLPATSANSCTVPPQVGMPIEKVARTSGYTSSTVDAVGTQIHVVDPNTGKTSLFKNMIWTQAFFLGGDSGAIACKGGNGRTFVPPPAPALPCLVLASVGHYFSLPLPRDNSLTTRARKQFLSQSLIGNLMIGLIYNNTDTVVKRTKGKKGTDVQIKAAAPLYKRYRHFLVEGLDDPTSRKLVVTRSNIDDFNFILMGLAAVDNNPKLDPPLITIPEYKALHKILTEIAVHTEGMDQKGLIRFMNKVSVYEKIVAELKKARTIKLTGTIAEDELH